MSRTRTILAATVLAALTGIVHLIGTLMPVPTEQTNVIAAIATMKDTMVPMPVGAARSYMQILNGNNFGTVLLLFVCAAQLAAVAKLPSGQASNRAILITAMGLVGFAVISMTHFFIVPALFTGIAAILCLIAYTR